MQLVLRACRFYLDDLGVLLTMVFSGQGFLGERGLLCLSTFLVSVRAAEGIQVKLVDEFITAQQGTKAEDDSRHICI